MRNLKEQSNKQNAMVTTSCGSTCIDKSSSAELSEAINSMYGWYELASVCNVYLTDVTVTENDGNLETQLRASTWFTRGWTLQELLAPKDVLFYSIHWNWLGDKQELRATLSGITGIDEEYLTGDCPLSDASIAKRMSWASRRQTKRTEDMAYCLLGKNPFGLEPLESYTNGAQYYSGIFMVNMPLLYGEGQRAFIRLQEEIMKSNDDHSLFAWVCPLEDPAARGIHGLLADTPAWFDKSAKAAPYIDSRDRDPFSMTNKGLSIRLEFPEQPPGSGKQATLWCRSPVGDHVGLMTISVVQLRVGIN